MNYANTSGRSNVRSYETGPDYIAVTFGDGSTYTYTHASASKHDVTAMKWLALQGHGLNGYIMRRVKHRYA